MAEQLEWDEECWDDLWKGFGRRLRRWRVPPHHSLRSWWEEAEAEGHLATCLAIRAFDPSRGVPLGAFLHRRTLTALRTFHRREWSYGRRRHPMPDDVPERGGAGCPDRDPDGIERLLGAIEALNESDRNLIRHVFFEGSTEAAVAASLGISQQAVSKRKRLALERLRRLIVAPHRDLPGFPVVDGGDPA